ncbi:FAD-dependent monooxygenase [Sphingomonas sp. MG17]|uniref:FAD-dependent monooxygenase n=2 Tax=Sphingomonas tagetis TaxID=2949092 RepID=A0A9X2HNA0_9SPHN|nr:FAD-dependent monooxygenase [Sphingomonas tagetis]
MNREEVLMTNKNILIAGGSIAGTALAFWLARGGFSVTLVELAPALRQGGQGVDVRDQAIEVVERMGLMGVVRGRSVDDIGANFVNARNRVIGSLDLQAIQQEGGGAAEIRRGELAQLLYENTLDRVEYIFGNAISGIEQDETGVDITFEHGPPRRFDLVIGADGFHSGVRRIVFGPSNQFVRFKEHYFAVAKAGTPLAEARRSTIYNEPGKSVMVQSAGNAAPMTYFAFHQKEPLEYHYRDIEHQRQILRNALKGVGWETSMLLEQADVDPHFYLDAQAQIVMPGWSKGRVVLAGDAAHCASPFSGAGGLLALVGTYRLAGELVAAAGDHRQAFTKYEIGQRPLVLEKQGHLFTGMFVPRTWLGIKVRNGLVRSGLLRRAFGLNPKKIDSLPDYGM